MTMENNTAITAFIQAQATMGGAIKSAKNPYFKNNYADLSDIQEAVYPAFHAQGFAITQECGADDFGKFVETVALHASGHAFRSRVYIEHKSGDMQSLGSAITYARRYGLMALTGIPTIDDDGNAANGRKQQQQQDKPFDPRELSDKMIHFFEHCTEAKFEAQRQRSLESISKIEEHSIPMSLEVRNHMEAAAARLGVAL